MIKIVQNDASQMWELWIGSDPDPIGGCRFSAHYERQGAEIAKEMLELWIARAARAEQLFGALEINEFDFKEAVRRFSEILIHRALERTGGNKKAAATLLGMKRTTLHETLARCS